MQPGLEGPALKAESAYFLSEPAPRRMIRRRAERRRGHLQLPPQRRRRHKRAFV